MYCRPSSLLSTQCARSTHSLATTCLRCRLDELLELLLMLPVRRAVLRLTGRLLGVGVRRVRVGVRVQGWG